MTAALAVTAVVAIAGLSLTVVALSLRHSGLKESELKSKEDKREAERERASAETKLKAVAAEYTDYRMRTGKLLADIRAGIETLERDLDRCRGPGDRRRWLERLLSKAKSPATPAGGDS